MGRTPLKWLHDPPLYSPSIDFWTLSFLIRLALIVCRIIFALIDYKNRSFHLLLFAHKLNNELFCLFFASFQLFTFREQNFHCMNWVATGIKRCTISVRKSRLYLTRTHTHTHTPELQSIIFHGFVDDNELKTRFLIYLFFIWFSTNLF